MAECGRLRPQASEPLKQDVVVVAILVDVVAAAVNDDYDDVKISHGRVWPAPSPGF